MSVGLTIFVLSVRVLSIVRFLVIVCVIDPELSIDPSNDKIFPILLIPRRGQAAFYPQKGNPTHLPDARVFLSI